MNVVVDLDQKSRIAVVGDWGTGDEVAINLLQQVASLTPEVLIHLGDVHYAGTQREEQAHFLDVCRQVFGNDVPLFSLCGNHDMYSGGAGYYWLVDHIGQQASYFCLRNANWQFLAMDTRTQRQQPYDRGGQYDQPYDGRRLVRSRLASGQDRSRKEVSGEVGDIPAALSSSSGARLSPRVGSNDYLTEVFSVSEIITISY
jgi:hypothetical protein